MRKRSWKHSASMPKLAPEDKNAELALKTEKWRPLPRDFFDGPPEQVSRLLLGKILVRRGGDCLLAGRIVETEAYLGEHDAAAHAASGKTARNAVLFGPPGYAYIYNIYGLHACLNVSCLPDGDPGGVLFRALEPLLGLPQMRRNRGLNESAGVHQLTSGPGKLCQALGITREEDNGLDLTRADGRLCLMEDDFECGEIRVTPRIGISKAADWPLRFFLAGNTCVSGRRT
jgi:DNA-3-methyladenine glycosylase